MPRITAIALITLLATCAPVGAAEFRFVSPGGSGDACTNVAPCSLATATGNALEGDTLALAAGTYTGTGTAVIEPSVSLVIRGGWDGTATFPPVFDPEAAPVFLDGQGVRRGVIGEGPQWLVLEGLTIVNGFASAEGGGLYVRLLDLTLRNVTVSDCLAGSYGPGTASGGGLHMEEGTLTAVDSVFRTSTALSGAFAGSMGGGIWLQCVTRVDLDNCAFNANNASLGAGVHASCSAAATKFTIRRSSFRRNGLGYGPSADNKNLVGGGANIRNADLVLEDTEFVDGFSGDNGAGANVSNGTLTARRVVFATGESRYAAGLWLDDVDFALENLLFRDNLATGSPSPVSGLKLSASAGTLKHATVVGADKSGIGVALFDGSTFTGANVLLARLGTGVAALDASSTVTLVNTFVGVDDWGLWAWFAQPGGGVFVDTGTLTGDPGFADPGTGDYRLLPTSAARNKGVKAGVTLDLDRGPRDDAPDIGADEVPSKLAVTWPLAGEALVTDADYEVRWTYPPQAVTFSVFFSANDGATWRRLASSTPLSALAWEVPFAIRKLPACRIKVVGYNAAGGRVGSAVSGKFAVEPARVLSPVTGDALTGGSVADVSWWTRWLRPTRVVLEYTVNGGATWRLGANLALDQRHAFWSVPAVSSARRRCQIRLKYIGEDNRVFATIKSGWFTIRP